jgi:hypothetical protein
MSMVSGCASRMEMVQIIRDVETNSCLAPHFQYHVSGTLMVKMDDGTVLECKPGDISWLQWGMMHGW